MLSVVKAKLALLIQTKVAAAVVGAVLVAGGGTAVAAVATHGHLNQIGSGIASVVSGNHGKSSTTDHGNAGDHQSAEGTLTAYTAPSGSTAGSITVQPGQGSALTFAVNSDTKVNGYRGGAQSAGQQSGGQRPTGTPGAGQKGDGGQAGALTLDDLTAAIGHKVQVQATKSGDTWVAWKVTIEGAMGSQTGDQDGGSQQDVSGTVKSVAGNSFVLTTAQGDVTVTLDGSTRFTGSAHAAAVTDLKAGMRVEVQGTRQGDGSILARTVEVQGADGSGDGKGGDNGHPTPSPETNHD